MDAAVAVLLFALLGVAGSVVGVWLQQRHETKRTRMQIAFRARFSDSSSAASIAGDI